MIGSFVITAVQKWIAGDKHDKVAHLTFRDLLTAFAAAVEANDGEGLASFFTEVGHTRTVSLAPIRAGRRSL